ncbi:MAG TPA: hypothetical protein VM737_02995 [Gemmatimonadota bacterium]|nr:hypothetical protein [Gemmatimonadota bacterium]
MKARGWFLLALLLTPFVVTACERQSADDAGSDEVQVDEDLGTLRVMNEVNEPVAVYLDGQELYAVPPGRSYTFRNLPTRTVSIYGVGRISQKHFGLPELTIEEGGEYEWTIQP